jgi:hypothetical protein
MATHAIGNGTRNMLLNVPIDEKNFWGRLAFLAIQLGKAKSVGDFQKQVLEAGLEKMDGDAAFQLRLIRKRYYGTTASLLLGGLMLWQAAAAVVNNDRDAARRTRVVRGLKPVIRKDGGMDFDFCTV